MTTSLGGPRLDQQRPGGGLATMSQFLYLICALAVIGSVISGGALIIHSNPTCGANPYNVDLTFCTGTTHPFVGIGIAVLIGGLVQALVIGVVARLCKIVAAGR